MSNKVDSFSFSIIRKSRISSLRLPDGETRRKGARTTKNLWVSKLRCRCGSSYRIFNWRKLKDGTPVFGYQALCKQADDEVARLEQELKALSPAPDPQTVSSDMKDIYDFLSQKVDVHGACLAPELIDQFIEVVTPIADYSYRWKLNTGCKKSKEERTDLMAVSEKPILTFTIDFETAKRYREANKMPHQFRRAAWTDLTVEVYL